MSTKRSDLYHIPLSQIESEIGFNIRYDYGDIEGLAASIVANGVKNPIRVTKVRGQELYTLTDGHRRFQALNLAYSNGEIPADYLVPALLMDRGSTEMDRTLALITSNDGKPLNLLEEAEVFQRLITLGQTQEGIARSVGRTPAHVSNLMMLINKASDSLKASIKSGTVSASLVIQELKRKDSTEIEEEVTDALKEHGVARVSKKHLMTPKKQVKAFYALEGITEDQTFSGEELIQLLVRYKRFK